MSSFHATGAVFTVVGGGLFLLAVAMLARQVRRVARWTRISGTVIGHRTRRSRREGRSSLGTGVWLA